MTANSNSNIGRTADVVTDKSEVEIYLDTRALDKVLLQYGELMGVLNYWAAVMEQHNKDIQNNTSGQTTISLAERYSCFKLEHFNVLRDNTKTSIDIMKDEVSVKAKNLLTQCENFYEIIVGNEVNTWDNNVSTLTSILYLDATSYENGTMEACVNNATFQLNNISADDDTLEGILNSLNYKDCLDNCSADIENIHVDCKKNVRLVGLFMAFKSYVEGVSKFNEDIACKYDKIINPSLAFDYTRTYEYPYIKDDSKKAVLDRMLRNELHEMGVTDEMIDNATKKSLFTLNSLAKAMEAVIAEDKAKNNDGKEIALYLGVLSGNSQKAYDKYFDSLSDDTWDCWMYIAKYQMGLLHTECVDGKHQFNGSEGDEAYINYINEINAVTHSRYADKLINRLKAGAYRIIEKCAKDYLITTSLAKENDFKNDVYREEYRKNFLLYDTYYFLEEKMVDDRWVGEKTATNNKFIGDTFDHYKHVYNIEEITYDNAGIHLSVSSSVYVNAPNKSPLYSFDTNLDSEVFQMDIQTHVGVYGVNHALSVNYDDKKIQNAYKAQEEMLVKMGKDGVLLGVASVNPVAAELVNIGFDVLDGETSSSDAKDILKFSSRKSAEYYMNLMGNEYDTAIGNAKCIRATDLAVDTYNYLSSTSIRDSLKMEEANSYARLAGSVGCCTITGGDSGNTTYVNNHAGLYAPGHEKTYISIATPGHGVAEMCKWSEKDVNDIKEYLDNEVKEMRDIAANNPARAKAANKTADELQERNEKIKLLIDGGYPIDEKTDFSKLEDQLSALEKAREGVVHKKDAIDVWEAWDSEIEDLTVVPD